jgi:hypothetical protein
MYFHLIALKEREKFCLFIFELIDYRIDRKSMGFVIACRFVVVQRI